MNSTRWRDSSSTASTKSAGEGMVWILDHMLKYPKLYRSLPLRTTYILNSTLSTTSDFQSALLKHIEQLPSQPLNLPASFLSTFITRTFPEDLELVAFDQALTALDYLKYLDDRRRKAVADALVQGKDEEKLEILKTKCGKVDKMYANALIGIRRWALINEIQTTPFNKFHCMAMLNTLFPLGEEPPPPLSKQTLVSYRTTLWDDIQASEDPAQREETLRDMKDRYDWIDVHDKIHAYIRVANDVISDAGSIVKRAVWESTRPSSRPSLSSSRPGTGNTTNVNDVDEFCEVDRGSTLENILWELENTRISGEMARENEGRKIAQGGHRRGGSSASGQSTGGSISTGVTTFYDDDRVYYT